MNNTEKTIQYYDKNTVKYVQDTIDANMTFLQNEFLHYIKRGGRILDLGCGSGRDSYTFIKKGFDVVAVDGSKEMCKMASDFIGQDVEYSTFQEYEPVGMFDGIWACASLMHLDKQSIVHVSEKLLHHLNDGGVFYLSFKYGSGSSFIRNRFYTKLDEQTSVELFQKISDAEIQKQFTTNDVRSERDSEKWLNVFLVKKSDATVPESQDKYICRLESINDDQEAFIYKAENIENRLGKQTFLIKQGTPNIDFERVLAEIHQHFYMGDINTYIEKASQYIIEIPIEYEKPAEEVFSATENIEENFSTQKSTNEEGEYKITKNLTIKRPEFFDGNTFLDIAKKCYNLAARQQVKQLSKEIEKTYDVVRDIEKGQMEDRIAYLKSGKEQIMIALALKDESERRRAISIARSDLMTAKYQIGLHFKRKCEEFKPVPGNSLVRFFSELMESGYLRNKDTEVYNLQQYYKFFLEATELLAASYLITDEEEAAKAVFQGSIDFMKGIDFSNVKSVSYAKKKEEKLWFYDKAIAHFKAEQRHLLESVHQYEYVAVEVTGEELLGAAKL